MNLNRCFLISQNISADIKGPKVKYKVHYGRCTGPLFRGNFTSALNIVLVLIFLSGIASGKRVGHTLWSKDIDNLALFWVGDLHSQ